MTEYVKIYCCGDCIYYDWKKHKCKRGAKDDDGSCFFRDCPIGIHEEKDDERVDAIPVVRCKDCKHWSGRKYNVHINGFLPWCRFSALQREANDYCSYGERKDGENGKTD